MSDSPLPALRHDLEVMPIEHEGRPMFLLQDHEGIAPQPLVLSPAGLAIAFLLNGRHSLSELQALLTRETGSVIQIAQIQGIVETLGRAKYLETSEVQESRRRMLEDFLASPIRKAALEGAYPKEPLELAKFMGAFFRDPKGPGEPLADQPSRDKPPRGLVCPHIDLYRGGPAYAWAYRALSQCPPPDLIVAVGVAHAGPPSPWIMTRKAYETPYGPMEVDAGLYDEIRSALWYDPLDDEWAHRREHSLEFQALWLKHLWRERAPAWVPILCSSFERFSPDKAPSSTETVDKALSRVGEMLAERAKRQRVMVLAGIDLAHVGPKFGDDLELTPELGRKLEAEDRATLDHALKLEADAFYLSAINDGHWRKICGLSALYTSLRLIRALPGTAEASLLAYGQAPDPMGGIVSFASAVFPS
ncbi:MAG: AmmeMemoRadiSam system protein B [Elusimicrobia bacterium]|nr:AmmeMemoRadiSam system protein B [Elusimicrobiota bacterium]